MSGTIEPEPEPEEEIPVLDEEALRSPDGWVEVCPTCHGRCNGCMNCWDTGVVPHDMEHGRGLR